MGDDAGDLVAGDHGVGGRAPLAADVVDVGVADAAVLDLDEDVVGADITALDGGRRERFGRGCRGVGGDGKHGSPVGVRWVGFSTAGRLLESD